MQDDNLKRWIHLLLSFDFTAGVGVMWNLRKWSCSLHVSYLSWLLFNLYIWLKPLYNQKFKGNKLLWILISLNEQFGYIHILKNFLKWWPFLKPSRKKTRILMSRGSEEIWKVLVYLQQPTPKSAYC